MQSYPISQKGFDKLVATLKNLQEVERPQTVIELDIARDHGDLKENAEYHAAKEKLAFIDKKIDELTRQSIASKVINPKELEHKKISFGSHIRIQDLDTDKISSYTIVGDFESNPSIGHISISTPIAKALLGASKGDIVSITLPKGEVEFEVLEILFKESDFE